MNIISPVKIQGKEKTLEEIKKANLEGNLHLLYTKYQKLFGKNNLSSNLLVPYIFENNFYDLYIINHPDDAERIASKHIKKMPNLKTYLFDSIISTTNKDKWDCQREKFTPAFSVLNELKKIVPISVKRAKICSELLWEISNKGYSEVNINDFFLNETLAQLHLAMFGFSNEFQENTNKKIREAFNTFNIDYGKEYGIKLLKNIKKSSGPLSKAMNIRKKDTISETETFGNGIIFTFAGHDTTGHTLSWLIYELCKNKKYQFELQREVDNFWSDIDGKEIEYSDLKKLPFMTKCIFETLRLWPAIPNGTFRELETDDYITGLNNKKVHLKKGTFVQISNWARHHNPLLWGTDVKTFNPYREFIEDENWDGCPLASYNPNSERFSPFTYGPRDCIGKNFAQIEMRIILLHLFNKYNFSLPHIQNSMDNEKLSLNGFTMGPRNPYNQNMSDKRLGLYVHVSKRNQSKL